MKKYIKVGVTITDSIKTIVDTLLTHFFRKMEKKALQNGQPYHKTVSPNDVKINMLSKLGSGKTANVYEGKTKLSNFVLSKGFTLIFLEGTKLFNFVLKEGTISTKRVAVKIAHAIYEPDLRDEALMLSILPEHSNIVQCEGIHVGDGP
ncbi:hypothetical protein M1146_08115, partial [Patescibacteria group bacterium]|nr:hypothetical protein [Patescibacteria group bacterium]